MLNRSLKTWMSRVTAAAVTAAPLAAPLAPLAPLAALAALAALTGCSTQRPLPTVWEQGNRAFDRSDFHTARQEYGEYLERKPGEARVQLRMAQTLLELGRAAEAVEFAAIAHDLRPGDEAFVETYARALFEAGRMPQLSTFLRTMTADRGLVSDYIRLGDYAGRLGDPDSAEHALLMAARLDGGSTVGPQLALADFYTGIKDLSNAKRRLRMALFIEPGNMGVHERLRALGEIPGPSFAIAPEESN
jgi:tetratricopeptide (TPR) repeat protein